VRTLLRVPAEKLISGRIVPLGACAYVFSQALTDSAMIAALTELYHTASFF
jgi:hypothetical protein